MPVHSNFDSFETSVVVHFQQPLKASSLPEYQGLSLRVTRTIQTFGAYAGHYEDTGTQQIVDFSKFENISPPIELEKRIDNAVGFDGKATYELCFKTWKTPSPLSAEKLNPSTQFKLCPQNQVKNALIACI